MAHKYIIGGSGVGKSSLLKQQILNDIKDGNAVIFIDPHGYDTDDLLQYIPRKRLKDTILFDPTDTTHLITWNPLGETDNVSLLANTMTNTIRSAWGMTGISTPNVTMIVESLIYTAREHDLTIYECLFLLFDKDINYVRNPVLELFWENYFQKAQRDKEAVNSSTVNKLFTLLLDPQMQKLFDTSKGQFSVSDAVKDKILFIRLPQGQLGLEKVTLLGSILLAQIHLACLRRDTDIPLSIYIDEVHSFAHSTISEMLSGVRKFNVHVTLAHQYIAQLEKTLFASIMGNCDTRLIFKISPEDASEFQECKRNGPICLEDLDPYSYRIFPWHTTDKDGYVEPLPEPLSKNMRERVIKHTHENYCREL